MPKKKTNRAAAKRFKLTATGKIKRGKAYHRHILSSKDRKRKNRLGSADLVHEADVRKVKQLIGF
ncbi:MAG: 50S ribosomal protein L35 [Acidobacteriota bacterium]